MKILPEKKLILFPAILGVALLLTAYKARENSKHERSKIDFPSVMLWAWERPEDLSFIDPSKTGVAFLAKTIRLQGANFLDRPRLQSLKVGPDTPLVAVTRIEVDHHQPFAPSSTTLIETAQSVADTARLARVSMVQVDFDAVVSERRFYRDLLKEIRSRLPSSTRLSITALASWCEGDNWLSDLPIDEAVPMFFRMGVEKTNFADRVKTGTAVLNQPCKSAAGISTDEPVGWPRGRRVYLFNPNPWTKEEFEKAMEASLP